LAAGEPQDAIHLVEVALGGDPANSAALEVGLAAHRQLDAESENFWLSAWLRKEIASLEARLAASQGPGQ
jgi:hypothetical protein